MKAKLTPTFVRDAKAAPGAERTVYWDEALPGFGLVVTAAGHKAFVCQYRAGRRSRRMNFKRGLSLDEARKQARGVIGAVAKDRDPLAERRKAEASAENTLRSVVENYLAREGNKLRTADDRRATFERLVFPKLGARQITDIKRSEINSLLDKIEDENGPRMATLTLAYLRRAMNWHSTRADDFRSPIVKGMARGTAGKRDRILTDDELRTFWQASQGWDHPFSHMLRFVLLTAVRRDEAADMRWSEIDGDVWTIPAARYKTDIDLELPLSRAALGGFAKFKVTFDGLMLARLRKLAEENGAEPAKVSLARWTIHDLRRTARSLMTRAGIEPDHAERALGHVIAGVRRVYDRHHFRDEKRRAFEALAAQLDRIVNPQPNVVAFTAAR